MKNHLAALVTQSSDTEVEKKKHIDSLNCDGNKCVISPLLFLLAKSCVQTIQVAACHF